MSAGAIDGPGPLSPGRPARDGAGDPEILLGVLLAVGLFRVPVAWIALAVNAVSTLGSWRQLVDPWGLLGLTEGAPTSSWPPSW